MSHLCVPAAGAGTSPNETAKPTTRAELHRTAPRAASEGRGGHRDRGFRSPARARTGASSPEVGQAGAGPGPMAMRGPPPTRLTNTGRSLGSTMAPPVSVAGSMLARLGRADSDSPHRPSGGLIQQWGSSPVPPTVKGGTVTGCWIFVAPERRDQCGTPTTRTRPCSRRASARGASPRRPFRCKWSPQRRWRSDRVGAWKAPPGASG